MYLTINRKATKGWYRKKLAGQPYIMYPACSSQIVEHGTIAPETMSNLLLQYPMLKEYMKSNNSGQPMRAHDMKPAYVIVKDRRGIGYSDWLHWDVL